jgi:hypothetical protein
VFTIGIALSIDLDKYAFISSVVSSFFSIIIFGFSELLGISPFTLRGWRNFFEVEKPQSKYPNFHRMKDPEVVTSKGVKPKPESFIKISNAETRESALAKKKIRNKENREKEQMEKLKAENPKIIIEKKEETTEDIKAYLSRSIDKAIPIVNTRGDIIPQKFRNMQEEWMAKNKVKKYSGGGTLLN